MSSVISASLVQITAIELPPRDGTTRQRRVASARLSFPKIRSARIRAVRENQSILQPDGCDHLPACDVYRRSAQVAGLLDLARGPRPSGTYTPPRRSGLKTSFCDISLTPS